MKITYELLNQYKACESGLNWFRENYPNGVELAELITNPNLTYEQLFWGAKYIKPSAEELAAYNARLSIVDSERVVRSKSITSSHDIFNSTVVTDSAYITDSLAVFNSNNILGSEDVVNSSNVFNSEYVEESQKIIMSKGVHYSDSILNSHEVGYCSNLLNCTDLLNTIYCYNSQNVENSAFCGYCCDCKNCLFSLGLHGESYCIFNQHVSIDEWEKFNEILKMALQSESSTFIKINPFLVVTAARFQYSFRLDSLFDGLSQNFFGWVGTLPNYNEKIFLDLFFRS